jgi:hypothetical protein
VADILLDEQGTPTAPAAGQMIVYPDNQSSVLCQRDDAGRVQGRSRNASVAQQTGFAADTYLTGSGLQIPSLSVQAGMIFIWEFIVTKTAAGVATPIYQVRIGAAQTTADTSRLTLTGPAQTAAIDIAKIRIVVTVRSVSPTGVIQGHIHLQHNLAATGFANTPAGFSAIQGTSAAFDNTALGGLFVGLSVNGGAAAAWTIEQVFADARY